MRHKLFIFLFLCTISLFSSQTKEDALLSLQKASDGFYLRWEEFQLRHKAFSLWEKNLSDQEIENRFLQLQKTREDFYFSTPEAKEKQLFRKEFESGKVTGSRYNSARVFAYNLASENYNASIISFEDRKFLALEGPLKGTLFAFFSLLENYQVTDLVRLAPAMYRGKEICFPYWEGRGHIDETGEPILVFEKQKIRYFFTDQWVEDEPIEPKCLIALAKTVMKKEENQIIAVHCKAGISRTGAFIATCALIDRIDKQIANHVPIDQIEVSIDKIVLELSLQRPFMIPRLPHYKLLYDCVNTYIEMLQTQKGPDVSSI